MVSQRGATVTVIYVPKSDAKTIKSRLGDKLNRDFRLTPVGEDQVAVPVVIGEDEHDTNLFVRTGQEFCLYSASYLARKKPSNPKDLTTVQQALLKVLERKHASQKKSHDDDDTTQDETTSSSIQTAVKELSISTCPRSLEYLGDDRTLVLPRTAFDVRDPSLARLLDDDSTTTNTWLDLLWQELASAHGSPRVVRRGTIDPDSAIRESRYEVLWTSLPNNNWITVTEHGIRQSFDLTRVMFSRGNVGEKKRFGCLVRPGERVLDLYAGIGYFTLPALILGKARHVVCCEWNPQAVQALQRNLVDNGVDQKATVLQRDCRNLLVEHPDLLGTFDRVSLGLLPSSQGGWQTAVKALCRDKGGWLHVHGNVVARESMEWCKWVAFCLAKLQPEWAVVVRHLEKVKSFAPTVNHYVADVQLGPPKQLGVTEAGAWIALDDARAERVVQVDPPSCALSDDGPLHQEWMR